MATAPATPTSSRQPPAPRTRPAELAESVDVLIVGSGPAGTLLAAQLSTFPGISTRLVERRNGPLQLGRADGVACRTVETFEAFGMGAQADPRGLLGQRDGVLAPFGAGPLEDRAHGAHPGHRGRPVGVSARHRQPGAHAGVPARVHAQVAVAAGARLRARVRRASKVERRGRPPRRASSCATSAAAARKSCAPSTSWVATARAAGCASRSAPSRTATSPTTSGAWWTCWRSPTSRTSA